MIKGISGRDFLLTAVTALLIVYLFSDEAKNWLSINKIDPNILGSFVASFTLIYAINDSVRSRNFAYKMAVSSRFQEHGMSIITALLMIERDRGLFIGTLEQIKLSIEHHQIYKDVNEIEKTALNSKTEYLKAASAIDTHFPTQSISWNEIMDAMSTLGSISVSTKINYEKGAVDKDFFEALERNILKLKEINMQLGEKPKIIRDAIIQEINERTLRLA